MLNVEVKTTPAPPVHKNSEKPDGHSPGRKEQREHVEKDIKKRYLEKVTYYETQLVLTPQEKEKARTYEGQERTVFIFKCIQERIKTQSDLLFASREESADLGLVESIDFFALVTAVQMLLDSNHKPSWEQARTALQATHSLSEISQKFQMRTGEGKTFVIAMSALWTAKHNRVAQIHTDKQVNVEAALNSYGGLYALMDVSAGKFDKTHLSHGHDLLVRYGVWSDFGHEYLLRRNEIERLTAELQKITTNVKVMTREQAMYLRQVQGQLAFLQQQDTVHNIFIDEADKIKRESMLIINKKSELPYSPEEQAEFHVVDKLLLKDQSPEMLNKLGMLFFGDESFGKRAFKITTQSYNIGEKVPDANIAYNSMYCKVDEDQVFNKSLYHLIEDADSLATILPFVEGETFGQEGGQFTLEPAKRQKIESYVRLVKRTHLREDRRQFRNVNTEPLLEAHDWEHIADLMAPVSKDLFHYYLFGEGTVFQTSPEGIAKIRHILDRSPNRETMNTRDWAAIEQIIPHARVRLTMVMMGKVVNDKWSSTYNEFILPALKVRFNLRKDEHFYTEVGENGEEVILLTESKEQGVGKEYQYPINELLALRLGRRLPHPTETIDEITPKCLYDKYQDQPQPGNTATRLNEFSGTMDEADVVVESEGKGERDWRPSRVIRGREKKLDAIVKHAQVFPDKPLLICVDQPYEFYYLENQLLQAEQKVRTLTARNMDDAHDIIKTIEPGTRVLLLLTSRGLDPGTKKVEEDTGEVKDTFENAHVIMSEKLRSKREEIQTGGRVGGKRASGKVFVYMSFEDAIAQEAFDRRKDVSKKFHRKGERLNERYLTACKRVEATVNRRIPESRDWNWGWPETIDELVAEIELLQERARDASSASSSLVHQEENEPQWKKILQPALKQYARYLDPVVGQYRTFSKAFEKQLNYQQDINSRRDEEIERERTTQDPTLQSLRNVIMRPDSSTQLGQRLLGVSYEQRQRMWIELIQVSEDVYKQSVQWGDLKRPFAFNERPFTQQKKERYGQVLTEVVSEWVSEIEEERKLNEEYLKDVQEPAKLEFRPPIQLPETFSELDNFITPYEKRELRNYVAKEERMIHRGELLADREKNRKIRAAHWKNIQANEQRRMSDMAAELETFYQLPLGQRIFYEYIHNESDPYHARRALIFADKIQRILNKEAQLQHERDQRLKKKAGSLSGSL